MHSRRFQINKDVDCEGCYACEHRCRNVISVPSTSDRKCPPQTRHICLTQGGHFSFGSNGKRNTFSGTGIHRRQPRLSNSSK